MVSEVIFLVYVSIGEVQSEQWRYILTRYFKQKQVTELFEILLKIRNNFISSLPVACTGPVQSGQALQNHPVDVYSVILGNE